MKRTLIATTALAFAGGMAAADVSLSGSAELGVAGEKGKDAKLHRNIDASFALSGATDTGLSFGASIDLDEAAKGGGFASDGNVHISGVFGTLTLGDTDGGFDNALTEVGSATSITDNHTGHPGYNGNSGLDGFTGNGGNILRYDYTLGGITTTVSGEFGSDDSSDSAVGVGIAWAGDLGGIGIGLGLGYQTGSKDVDAVAPKPATDYAFGVKAKPGESHDASIIGASVSVDMGNGLSVFVNASSKDHDTIKGAVDTTENAETDDTAIKITHAGVGVAYTVGDLTFGVNGGQSNTKGTMEHKASGAGFAAVYSLGSGASFQVGVGGGKGPNDDGDIVKSSSWSAGLAFSF